MAYRLWHPNPRKPEPPVLDTPTLPNDLESIWLPFTPNADFKSRPRLLAKAEGM